MILSFLTDRSGQRPNSADTDQTVPRASLFAMPFASF